MAAEAPAAADATREEVKAAEPPAAADEPAMPSENRNESIGTAALEALKDLPPGINGVALGCAAFANLLHVLYPNPAVLVAALSATLWLLFLASRLAAPHRILEEIKKPRSFFPYGAWEMAFAFAWARLPLPCEFGAYAAGVLQLIIMILFLKACWRDGAAPEPYWNPAVHVAGAATTYRRAPCLGARHWLSMGSFGLALLICLMIAPPEAYGFERCKSESPR